MVCIPGDQNAELNETNRGQLTLLLTKYGNQSSEIGDQSDIKMYPETHCESTKKYISVRLLNFSFHCVEPFFRAEPWLSGGCSCLEGLFEVNKKILGHLSSSDVGGDCC